MKRLAVLALLALAGAAPISTPTADRRPPDQTFLTIPEWFLVFSPEEYANFIGSHLPSGFPFFGHLDQFWQGYGAAAGASAPLPANAGYHLMVVVIGASTTIEYGLKGVYEQLIGHFTEQVADQADTSEDHLAARTAAAYVAFIKVHPWYEFDFITPLRAVWTDTGWWGPKPLRKWERKYLLTTEYLAKSGYGWALGKATRSTYERPIEQTVVIVGPEASRRLLALPRYQAFTDAAIKLARGGTDFFEIAGNRGAIVVTVLAGPAWSRPARTRELFRQPILTQEHRHRYAILCQVVDLGPTLRELEASNAKIEHIYDY